MDKQITVTLDEKTQKPLIEINGEWVGKEIKLIIKSFPRAYRIYKAGFLKELEIAKKKKEKTDATGTNKRKGSKQPTA